MATQENRIKGKVAGVFTNPDSGIYAISANSFTWGVGASGSQPSNLSFTGNSFEAAVISGGEKQENTGKGITFPVEYTYGKRQKNLYEYFSLGKLEYFNGEIKSATGSSRVQLDIEVTATEPVATKPATFSYSLDLINTPNEDNPTTTASADSVRILQLSNPNSLTYLKTPNNLNLGFALEGFGDIVGEGFSERNEFFVKEGETAEASLVGRFVDPIEDIIGPTKDKPDGAVRYGTANGGTAMVAEFTPNYGLTLDQAAKLLGFDHFNWYQVITKDPSNPFPNKGNLRLTTRDGSLLKTPYIDPPLGGYKGGSYTDSKGNVKPEFKGVFDDNLPFYLDEDAPNGSGEKDYYKEQISFDGKTLSTADIPNAEYFNDHPKKYTAFQTSLVGVFPDKTWQVLYTFNWKSNYSGTQGGVSRSNFASKKARGKGSVFDFKPNLNPADIPAVVRERMQKDGAVNASGAAATPLPVIDFSKRKLGRRLSGTSRSDKLTGTNKNDVINGRSSRDREFGKNGDDQLQGGKGNDQLSGGNDNDVLIGDLGNDILVGGKGRDTFTLTKVNDEVDTIQDFTPGVDLLDLRKIFASSAYTDVDIFSRFTEFLQVVSVGADSQVRINADGAGTGTSFVTLVTLKGVAAIDINTRSFVIG